MKKKQLPHYLKLLRIIVEKKALFMVSSNNYANPGKKMALQ